jgi:hypothetical protein
MECLLRCWAMQSGANCQTFQKSVSTRLHSAASQKAAHLRTRRRENLKSRQKSSSSGTKFHRNRSASMGARDYIMRQEGKSVWLQKS